MVDTGTVDIDRKLPEAFARFRSTRSMRQGSLPRVVDRTPKASPGSIRALIDDWSHEAGAEYEQDFASLIILARSLPGDEQPTVIFSIPLEELFRESSVDWDRWHDLLDIREQRALTQQEQAEYDRMAETVARLDAEEAATSNAAVDSLVKRHERVLASIERLTEAVRQAAQHH